ncbi:PIN domain-containing protein [Bacillus gobiensis]|uniref:PIN domain-containing protein n=1 Tax=Bacillus gobiensis TaxID=1441095 RepID=UPI003D24ABFC
MHIFLDTNVFYKDPFLLKGKNAILKRLTKHEDVKMYMNRTVYEEIFRAHKNFLEKQVKAAEESLSKLSPFLSAERDILDVKVDTDELLSDLDTHFNGLVDAEQLDIIPYDADVFTDIVAMDMYEKAPFIKTEQLVDKRDKKVPYKKKEMRDAIIWYTYQRYIEKHNLEECYFISNNVKEFGDVNAKNTPPGEPYGLHPEIAEASNLNSYRNAHDFLTHNADEIKELVTDTDHHSRLLSEDLAEQVEEELKQGLAAELVKKYLTDTILQESENYISEKLPDDIHEEYYMGGYVLPSFFSDIDNIKLQEVDVYGDDITVAVELEVDVDVDIYLYNVSHEGREDKHMYFATDVVKLEESVVFLIPLNNEKEIDTDNFSLRDYIDGMEPRNTNVEIIQRKTIEHTDMFYDEDYDEPHP